MSIVAAVVGLLAAPMSTSGGAAVEVVPAVAQTSSTTVEAASATVPAQPFALDRGAAYAAGLSPTVLRLATAAIACGIASGDIAAPKTLTVIDYSKPSVEPRLWVFDLHSGGLLFTEVVAHGVNTGDNLASRFSDVPNSRQSSLGVFVARETYVGSNGYSLRMDGMEPGFNGRARERAIVIHGAPYVDPNTAVKQGRLGRSWGCPALRDAVAREVIDTIRDGGVVFSYYPDETWLSESRFLNCERRTPDRPTRQSV